MFEFTEIKIQKQESIEWNEDEGVGAYADERRMLLKLKTSMFQYCHHLELDITTSDSNTGQFEFVNQSIFRS